MRCVLTFMSICLLSQLCATYIFCGCDFSLDFRSSHFLNCRILLIKRVHREVKTKSRKSTFLRCNAGGRLFPIVIWSLVGCLLLLQLCSFTYQRNVQSGGTHLSISQQTQFRELEEVEKENIQLPPPRKRSPRAAKRKPKRPTTLIYEFLDESSQLRHVFFPGQRTVVDPRKNYGNDTYCYRPGRMWLDTEGNPIQAHGGGILYDSRTKMYYWYGEYKDGPTYHAHKKGAARVSFRMVHGYRLISLY